MNWVPRGPTNVGGRTRSIIVHPSNPSIIWAGAVSGGIWKSIDGGASWFAGNSDLQNLNINCMTMDPNDANTLYVGTGEGFFGPGVVGGDGIHKSSDGGMTWQNINGPSSWSVVNRIAISPSGDTMLVAAANGIYHGSSTDGGVNWNWSDPPVLQGHNSLDVEFTSLDGQKAVAEIVRPTGNTCVWSHQAYYTDNGGIEWHPSSLDTGPNGVFFMNGYDARIEFAVYKPNPQIVYASYPRLLDNPPPACHDAHWEGRIAVSTDGGASFTERTPINDPSDTEQFIPTSYNNVAWVSPAENQSNVIVVGSKFLFRSTDGGNNIVRITDGDLLTFQPHHDQHCLVSDTGFNGGTNRRVYNCNDGGIFASSDVLTASRFGNSNWLPMNSTYQTTQYYGAAGSGATGLIYGGMQDNGTLGIAGGSQIGYIGFKGDGGFNAIASPTPANTAYCYGEHFYLQINRLQGCAPGEASPIFCGVGATWCYPPNGMYKLEDAGHCCDVNFIAPFVIDPHDSRRIIAGARRLWRTTDADTVPQPTWEKIKTETGSNEGDLISAIAIDPQDSNVIWVGHNDGKIYKSTNGTNTKPTWHAIDDNGITRNPLPNRFVGRIAVDPSNMDRVVVGFGIMTDIDMQANLFITNDGGDTWTSIAGVGLQRVPIRGIAIDPDDGNKIYLGTEIGAYAGVYAGGTWTWAPIMDGPVNVPVDEITFMPGTRKLLAATYGRGIWVSDLDAVPQSYTLYDFDGDGRADPSVFRPSSAVWHLQRSVAGYYSYQHGADGDIPVAADYDGDGKTDLAVYRPSNQNWIWIDSSTGAMHDFHFGALHDVPVPADFDGDGVADQAVFRVQTEGGYWYLNQSHDGFRAVQWGAADDYPVVGEFDKPADGRADLGVYRLKQGEWWLYTDNQSAVQWGLATDIPVTVDYDGDGTADVAVYRPDDHTWYLLQSTNGFRAVPWGSGDDVPVPADYDGDGRADVAVWRRDDGHWYLMQSSNGFRAIQFGANGDFPIPEHVFAVPNRPWSIANNKPVAFASE